MVRRLFIPAFILLTTLLLSGCGNQTTGKGGSGLGAPEIAAMVCGAAGFLLVPILAITGVMIAIRRRKKSTPPPIPEAVPSTEFSIFISYRRNDSQDVAGRIYDALTRHFPRESIFKDVDSIPAGKDFRKVLHKAVLKADVVLVIIGPRWTQAKDASGARRLEDPSDFVRIEIESALEEGIPVIPVMVSNARMASAADLPESLSQLAFQNGIRVRPDPDFHRDMERLVEAIENLIPGGKPSKAPETKPAEPKPKSRTGFWLRGCALAAVLIVGGLIVLGVAALVITAVIQK